MKTNPSEALSKFKTIIEKEEHNHEENKPLTFKSLKYCFELELKLELYEDSLVTFKNILKRSAHVTFNEIASCVSEILNQAIKVRDQSN